MTCRMNQESCYLRGGDGDVFQPQQVALELQSGPESAQAAVCAHPMYENLRIIPVNARVKKLSIMLMCRPR